ncbi:unnamed protein product [Prorocentrum cordatum]|uniref:Uncharacterized protein n=1 Tax=Prorocentrum cordatum TaxID=2364126 RepID=A0ABN9V1T8_9DINO|nr:unnamed protein product [Polarella glacialis]
MAGSPLSSTERAKVEINKMSVVVTAMQQKLPNHRYVDSLCQDICDVLLECAKLDSLLLANPDPIGNDKMILQIRFDNLCKLFEEVKTRCDQVVQPNPTKVPKRSPSSPLSPVPEPSQPGAPIETAEEPTENQNGNEASQLCDSQLESQFCDSQFEDSLP